MQGTVVLPCSCKNEFQDKTYGKGNRLHNVAADLKKAACTVCSGGAKNAKRNSKSAPPTANRDWKQIK